MSHAKIRRQLTKLLRERAQRAVYIVLPPNTDLGLGLGLLAKVFGMHNEGEALFTDYAFRKAQALASGKPARPFDPKVVDTTKQMLDLMQGKPATPSKMAEYVQRVREARRKKRTH